LTTAESGTGRQQEDEAALISRLQLLCAIGREAVEAENVERAGEVVAEFGIPQAAKQGIEPAPEKSWCPWPESN
jgi:hypothetical protein